ncbi:MAG: recombinase family protein [Bacteroidales bacterium]|nr:recombinase family protein [Bacteroidales bacterium]
MEKVVILARVSTDKQEYQRQINELTDHCNRVGWSVEAVFSNKVSGAKRVEERPEIKEMIDYVKANQIDKVVCLEISRLGRNTLETLKVIQTLNEHGVSLYVKNYNLETLNPDGKVNPVASLICTILLEIASMERLTIKERMASGRDQYIARCKEQGINWYGEKKAFRTDNCNEYLAKIALLRTSVAGLEQKERDKSCDLSHLVAEGGLEPPTSGL